MNRKEATAVVRDAGDGLFIGITPGGHAQVLETNSERASAATLRPGVEIVTSYEIVEETE